MKFILTLFIFSIFNSLVAQTNDLTQEQQKSQKLFQKLRRNPKNDYFTVRTTKLVNKEQKAFLNMHNVVTQFKKPKSKKLYIDREVQFAHENYHKFYRLTAFEKRLLALLGDGIRPNDIANQMNTGYENIRKYVKKINEKLELIRSTHNKAAIYTKYAIYFHLI